MTLGARWGGIFEGGASGGLPTGSGADLWALDGLLLCDGGGPFGYPT